MDKTGRNGLRVGNLLDKSFTTEYIKLRLKHQKLLDSFNFQEDISAWESFGNAWILKGISKS